MKKILLIGFPNSVHIKNWINAISGNNKLYFFPSSIGKNILPKKKITIYDYSQTSYHCLRLFLYIIKEFFDIQKIIFNHKIFIKQLIHNKFFLREYIKELDPDIIHAFEFQHSGYLLSAALSKKNFFKKKIILSNYGSDVYYYNSYTYHNKQILKLLNISQECISESKRDINLIRGFNLEIKNHFIPNSAGIKFYFNHLKELKYRNGIIVKGYHGKFGRCLRIFKYASKIDYDFSKYIFYVYSANLFTRLYISIFFSKFNVSFIDYTDKKILLKYFANSKIYIGASISDGISTSALDAISTKTYPLQTDTSTLGELFNSSDIIYKLDDFDDFKNKLINVLNSSQDIQEKIDDLFQKSKKYDYIKISNQINKLYL